MTDAQGESFVDGRVIVTVQSGPLAEVALSAGPARISRSLLGGRAAVVELPAGVGVDRAIAELKASGRYAEVERDAVYFSATVSAGGSFNDPKRYNQWHLSTLNAEGAQAYTDGSGVTIAVLDTGIDLSDPDGIENVVAGTDIWEGDSDPTRAGGTHGSVVSSAIATRTDNGVGVSSLAPGVNIMPVRVCNTGCPSSDIIAGIEYATAQGVDVINMSLGGRSYNSAMATAVEQAHLAGILVAASAGNGGTSAVVYPSA